jgi:trehalose 6-phosphate synthase
MGPVLVCSHRGPLHFERTAHGLEARSAGPGGLVSVVLPAIEQLGGTWMFAPSSEEDVELARAGRGVVERSPVSYRLLDLPPEAHEQHYRTIYAALLVPLFHYLLPLGYAPTFDDRLYRAWESHRLVNQIYGRAIAKDRGAAGVLVEDAHLMLAAVAARSAGVRDVPLSYFHHLPWCEPEYFAVLPEPIRVEILEGLLAFDSVGFHCRRWLEAFAACCERFLPDTRRAGDRIEWRGRSAALVATPAAVDADGIAKRSQAAPTLEWEERLREICGGRRAVVRVDRTDPSKNAVRGLEAYELALERRPDLVESTCMVVIGSPVRQWDEAYRRYGEACEAAVERINGRFADRSGGPKPVHLNLSPDPHAFDHHRALGALRLADSLLVNPVFDGLNIVPMEGAIVGEPAVVLSKNAGAHDTLEEHVLSVNPFDVVQTAEAIERSIDEPETRRRASAAAIRRIATAHTPVNWVRARLAACT